MNDVLVLRVTGPFLLSGNGCILTFTCLSLSRVVGFLVLLMSSSADMLEHISQHGQKCAQQSTIFLNTVKNVLSKAPFQAKCRIHIFRGIPLKAIWVCGTGSS